MILVRYIPIALPLFNCRGRIISAIKCDSHLEITFKKGERLVEEIILKVQSKVK